MPTIQRFKRSEKEHDTFYDSKQWRATRAAMFIEPKNNLCYYCLQKGVSTPAFICDHVLCRRLFPELEWDKTNLVGACRRCDQKKRSLEARCKTRMQLWCILQESKMIDIHRGGVDYKNQIKF